MNEDCKKMLKAAQEALARPDIEQFIVVAVRSDKSMDVLTSADSMTTAYVSCVLAKRAAP